MIDATDARVDDFISHIDDYILRTPALVECDTTYGHVAIVPPKVDADAILYRRGVRITPQSFNRHSLYRYNFDDISINESRIFNYTYEWQERIAAALAKCTSIDILHAVLHELQQPHSDVLECEARWEYVHGM
jgi:hypothetical protein